MSKGDANTMIARIVRSSLARRVYFSCRRAPVLGPVLHRLADRVLPQDSRIWIRVSRGQAKGLWVFADPRFDPGYCNGLHEAWAQDLVRKNLTEGRCFYDVGAHVGFFSLIAARIVGPYGRVVAFEPDPKNALVFRENILRNHMQQVTLIEAAAWHTSGQLSFERACFESSLMEGHVAEQQSSVSESAGDSPRTLCVTAVSLDDYIYKQGGKPPNLLKLDVEGAEAEVVRGAARLFQDSRPDLLCEVHNATDASFVEAWLRERRYKLEWFLNGGSFPCALMARPE